MVGGPTGFVRLLRRLGPCFVEFGRFLALRPDFLPLEFRDELLESTEPRNPVHWAAIQTILAAEFPALDSVFESIDPAPFTCSPLCQFHRAATRDGRRVVIKVLLPDALRRAARDRRRVSLFVRLLDATGGRLLSPRRELLAEWKEWHTAELDLAQELASLMRLAESVSAESPLRIPRAFSELSTRRVLTFEDLGGLSLADVLAPARRTGLPLESYEFDAHTLATRVMETTVQLMFGKSIYNSAVHPAGIVLLPGNCFSFLNYAHCESMDPTLGRAHVRFLTGVFRTELPAVFRILESLLAPGDDADSEALRSDFILESHQWLRGDSTLSPRRGTRTHGSPLSTWLLAVLRAARRNGFRPPHEMLAAYRTLISAEWITNRLDSGVHLQSAGLEFLADVELDEALRILEPQVQQNALSDLLGALTAAPELLRHVLSDSVSGRLAANLNATPDSLSARMSDRRTKMTVAAIAAVAIAWLAGERSFPEIASLAPIVVLGPFVVLGPILAILYLYIAVQWRKLGK